MQVGRIRQGRASVAMPAAPTPAGAARRYSGTGMECLPGTYYAVPGETRALA